MNKTSPNHALIDKLRQMSGGFLQTQILYTAVRLKIADHLADGSMQVQELARAVETSSQALYRFLRMMVVLELLIQNDDGSFRLSNLGMLLNSNHPDSLVKQILYIGEINYPAAEGMYESVQSGDPAFDYIFQMSYFDYLAQHPRTGELFNDLMGQSINDCTESIISNYDFSKARVVVDIGGGIGVLIAAVMRAHPGLRGIVFDVPKVAVGAKAYLTQNSVIDHCQVISGNFFYDAIPRHADIYLMANIIRDWDDERAAQILRNCRDAMSAESTLLLIEEILPVRVADAPVTIANDFSMLLLDVGRERTKEEFGALLKMASLRIASIIPFEPSRIYNDRKPNWAIIESRLMK
jgi:hypothetical protein